jgi:hypothetical protein
VEAVKASSGKLWISGEKAMPQRPVQAPPLQGPNIRPHHHRQGMESES